MSQIKVTIYNEFVHEKTSESVAKIYPEGIHGAIASHLHKSPDITPQIATLEMPEHGLSEDVLTGTDVLIWWGHAAHGEVSDSVVDRVQMRILEGMGLIVLHSSHFSKVFRQLMGTGCGLFWREADERERLWVVNPSHPITEGIGPYIELPCAEMYGEYFDIPNPDELIFISWFEGGDIFRSGCTWHRGKGRIFYFRPGHETYPIYYNEEILRVLTNSVRWATLKGNTPTLEPGKCVNMKDPLERISPKCY